MLCDARLMAPDARCGHRGAVLLSSLWSSSSRLRSSAPFVSATLTHVVQAVRRADSAAVSVDANSSSSRSNCRTTPLSCWDSSAMKRRMAVRARSVLTVSTLASSSSPTPPPLTRSAPSHLQQLNHSLSRLLLQSSPPLTPVSPPLPVSPGPALTPVSPPPPPPPSPPLTPVSPPCHAACRLKHAKNNRSHD